MFRPFFAFVGYRYTRVKRKNHFISFISMSSLLGIALGVMVLITVLSVMNGFHREIRAQLLSGTPHITLRGMNGPLKNWQPLTDKLSHFPSVAGAAPYITGQGMLSGNDRVQGVMVKGIDPNQVNQVFPLADHIVDGSLKDLKSGQFGVVMGRDLANALGLGVGDKVSLIVPEATVTPAGIAPRIKRFTLVGVFAISYQYDNSQIFINLQDADKLFRLHGNVTGIQMSVNNQLQSYEVAKNIYDHFNGEYWVSDWTHEFGNFFQALKTEKTVMSFILSLIIAVAGFNLVSSLVMMVTDKRGDIAVLRTLGASRQSIMGIFVAQGSIIGIIGSVLGGIAGLFLAYNVTDWYDVLQKTFGLDLIAKDAYLGISFLPSEIHMIDVVVVTLITLLMSLLATVYPAWRAASVEPAEALRYE